MTKPKKTKRSDPTPDVAPEAQEALSGGQPCKPAKTKREPLPKPVVVSIEGPDGGPVDVAACIRALLRPALPGMK
ncbi:hypothetical protein DKM44_14045 [Deinococcus irradiatisoli]|uniref:Uncharacterized protein n=1 Tax=Deinococcus irradiatisoli TaxID=2202254 RepID=A0A2Z3JGD0_9DEIO|nr:hypothetical protein [Deinococcus irradiatisoli]AWN24213.1 hypothetical protein DKM44_14045 [Deinococcus irradiatisoli]